MLKQDQYKPMSVEDEVIAIWAGGQGFFDPIPVPQVREFERKLLDHLHSTHKELIAALVKDKDIAGDNEKALQKVVGDFQKSYLSGKTADPRSGAQGAAAAGAEAKKAAEAARPAPGKAAAGH
jgi:F-type H+-transporting ATPase subunit alpha